MAPKKSTPVGIDPANPNRNFVRASYVNKGDKEGFYKYMYGEPTQDGFFHDYHFVDKKPSGYGHSIGQRAGKLRLSGTKGAHRLGKR